MPADVSAPLSSPGDNEYVRLHITPLDAQLLNVVLPTAVQPLARNISYHTIDTFPERRYGFVELPQMDADKLKRKLNGSVLKGTKMRIEKARPEERRYGTGEDDEKVERKKKSKKAKKSDDDESPSSKKRKRDPDVMEGVALHDRKVKRGWTDAEDHKKKRSKKDKDSKAKEKEKKKRPKSKYTEQEECLLKTKIPPNAMGNLSADMSNTRKKKAKNSKSREVTVHEFEKTTKFPSFLKSSAPEGAGGKAAAEFVEGKGWVDEEGNVVEAVKVTVPAASKKLAKKKPVVVEEDDDSTSSSGTSSESESESESESGSDSEQEAEKQEDVDMETPKASQARSPASNNDSKSGSSSSSSSDASSSQTLDIADPLPTPKTDRPMSSSSSKSLTIKIPPHPATPSTKVHPLEALYKRPKPDAAAVNTPAKDAAQPFSFFGNNAEDEDLEDADADVAADSTESHPPVPMTPFTRQDFEVRTVRSAAPTPDTAHPSRMQNFWASGAGDDDDVHAEEYEEEDQAGDGAPAQDPSQNKGDFQAWFWANRREVNRSWMTRRKAASKEKRHRDNKARGSKAT